jgi:hypothetical protein
MGRRREGERCGGEHAEHGDDPHQTVVDLHG